ncbi:hypothetical protein GQ600_26442 [Phytophthora cactorum]|nr:hypothetical protein GQ600_26442 [Phytophthora cactorum]
MINGEPGGVSQSQPKRWFCITIQPEESQLADFLAPDKTDLIGCPSSPYEATKNTEEGPVLKRLRRLEALVLEMKAQISELASSNIYTAFRYRSKCIS